MTAPAQPPGALGELRVLKKLSPDSPGALKLARQYGAALVCVRHSTDARGDTRYTTVELLVDQAPVRARVDRTVGIRVGVNERTLQAMVRAAGARWDPQARLWRLPRRVVGILKLADRIVEK